MQDPPDPAPGAAASAAAGCGPLDAPDRVRALEETRLTEDADPDMERFAQRVGAALGVPVALVSLVRSDRQVFPGMVGLPEPWASRRSTPLTHSFCQHVVLSGKPLVIADARTDPLLRDNLAVPDLGVVAYAGMPLTDADGTVLGSLCAIDTRPREWTEDELATLADLAADCSTELRLRAAGFRVERERGRRHEVEDLLRASLVRTELLLAASQVLSAASDAGEVRRRLVELLARDLGPVHVDLVLTDDRGRLRPSDADDDVAVALAGPAARAGRPVHYADPAALDARLTADLPAPLAARARERCRQLGLRALVCAPAVAAGELVGVLLIGWDRPRPVDPQEHATIGALAGYAGGALSRAGVLAHRIGVAHELQAAMLSDLPDVDGLAMAARYLPADAREHVGGDWYDAVVVPDGAADRALAVTVGDVVGHAVHAATVMGQVRAMLRQAGWEHRGGAPSTVLGSLERACAALGVPVLGTAVHAHLRPVPGAAGRWAMTWTNAGHPAPLVLRAGGEVELLDERDMLFGRPDLLAGPRRDHRGALGPGDTLVLHTDGLVERRGGDVDDGVAALRALLGRLPRGAGPEEVVAAAVSMVGAVPEDDVVVMAVRVDDRPDGSRAGPEG